MPICTLHLLSLNVSLADFLAELLNTSVRPLTVGRVVRWIILPQAISTEPLLASNTQWDVLISVTGTEPLPGKLQRLIKTSWVVRAGIPSRIVHDFDARNRELLNPSPGSVPQLTGALEKPRLASSSQSLELTPELQEWISSFGKQEGRGAVSMLNLLAFKPGMKEEYLKYGKAFAESAGKRRGGDAKLVGTVVDVSSSPGATKEWDEIALAHYPSIEHFADMLASDDYQTVNHRYRVNSLKDTFILCTTELGLPWPSNQSARL